MLACGCVWAIFWGSVIKLDQTGVLDWSLFTLVEKWLLQLQFVVFFCPGAVSLNWMKQFCQYTHCVFKTAPPSQVPSFFQFVCIPQDNEEAVGFNLPLVAFTFDLFWPLLRFRLRLVDVPGTITVSSQEREHCMVLKVKKGWKGKWLKK